MHFIGRTGSLRCLVLALSAGVVGGGGPALAQVQLDGTVGPAQTLSGPGFVISDSLGRKVGPNLYHSFSKFNVNAGESATFTGSADTANVLARVTGGSRSNINGPIRTSGMPDANFYLINPAGVVFGPGAELDVGRAFVVTTADAIELSDGGNFDASNPADSVLTTAPPVAFGYLQANPASITVTQTTLAVGAGQTLAAVGGDVQVDGGQLAGPGGRIAIASVGSGGRVAFDASDPASDVGLSGFAQLGQARATQGAQLVTSANGGGRVLIRSGEFVLEDADVLARTQGDANGQPVDIEVTGGIRLTRSRITTRSAAGAGHAGNVVLSAGGGVVIEDGSLVSANTLGSGAGGRIALTADSVRIDGRDSSVFTGVSSQTQSSVGGGAGGAIAVAARAVELTNGGAISTASFGNGVAGDAVVHAATLRMDTGGQIIAQTQGSADGGDIVIHAGDFAIVGVPGVPTGVFADTSPGSTGMGGSIRVESDRLTVSNAGAISATSAASGRGGGVSVTARQVTLDGGGLLDFTGLAANSQSAAADAGAGGDVRVDAGGLRIVNEAAIAANTFGPGDGGNVEVHADQIVLEGAGPGAATGLFAQTLGQDAAGRGGNIHVTADELTLREGAQVTAASRGPGEGGDIDVLVGRLAINRGGRVESSGIAAGSAGDIRLSVQRSAFLRSDSSISAFAEQADGGDISLTAGDSIFVTASSISARAAGDGGNVGLSAVRRIDLSRGVVTAMAEGDGGNIDMTEPRFIVLDRSQLVSRAVFGDGGDITLVTSVFLRSPDSTIDASSQFGVAGTISITTPDADLAGTLTPLVNSLEEEHAKLTERCAVKYQGPFSSFIVVGRGGLPTQPGQFLPSFPMTIAPAPPR